MYSECHVPMSLGQSKAYFLYIHLLVGDLLLKLYLCSVIQLIKLQKLIANKNNRVHFPIFLLSVFDHFLIFSSPFLICIHFDAHQFVSLLLLFLQFSGSFGACTILFDLLPFELYFWCCFSCSVKKIFLPLFPLFFWFNSFFLEQEQTPALREQVNVFKRVSPKNPWLRADE